MKLQLSKEQWNFLEKLGITNREYTSEEIDDIVIDRLAEHLQLYGFNLGQESTNAIGDMCENIITALTKDR